MVGTFTFAGVMVLRGPLLLALVAVVYAAVWPIYREAKARLHRHVYTAATVALACLAAAAVMDRLPGGLNVPAGIAAFMAVNLALTLGAVVAARHWPSFALFTSPRTHLVVLTTQVCGALVGLGMQWHTGLAVAGLPMLAAVHSDALRGTLRDTAAWADGVCNRDLWLHEAAESYRTGEWFAVVLVETAAGAAQQSALSVLQSHARPGAEAGATGAAREPDVLGIYSPTQLVLLRHLTTGAASKVVAGKIAADLQLLSVPAGIGLSGSKQGSVAGMLAIASAESTLRWAVALSDPDGVR